ncbi:MAG: hypothetical protein KDK40_05345, partial [Chlamydiia bacterium]|nr:hypothetical protein [Chlamydiia bacterium]
MKKLQNDEIIKNLLLEVNQGQDLIHMFPYLDRFWRSAESIESPKIDESDSFVLKQLIRQSPNSVGIKGLIRGIGRIKRYYFQLVFQLPLFNAIKSGHEFYLAVSCVCQIDQFLSDCDAPALDQLMDAVAPLLKYCKTTYQAIEVIYAYAGYRPEFPLSVYKMPSEDLKLRVEKWADRLAPECLGEFIYALGLLPQVPDEEVDQLFYTLIENCSPDFISKCIHLITPLTTQARWEYLKAADRLKNKLSDWEEFNASLMLLRTFPENMFSKVVQLFEEGIIETRSNRESSQKCDEFRSIFEWIFDEGFSELTEQHIMDFYTFCYSDGIEFEEYFFNLFQKAWAKDPRYFRIFITNLAEFDSDSTKDTAVAGAILEPLQKTDVENWASEEINLLLLNLKDVGKGFHPEVILSLVNRSPRVCQVFVSLLDSPPEAMAEYCRDLKVAELYPSIERHIGEFEVNAVYDLYISVQNGFLKCLPDREVKILELSKKHPLFMENALSLPENLEKIKSFLLDDEGKVFLEGFRRMIWSKCCALRKLVEELYPLKTDANLKYYAPHAFVNSRQCLSIYSPREIASQRPEEILEEVYPLISGTKREDLPTSLWVKWTLDSGIDQSGVSKELVTSIAEGVVKKMKMGKQKIPLPISLDQEKKSEDETELSDLYLQFGVFLRFLLHLGGKFPTGSLFELEVYDVLLNKVQSSMAYEEMINAYLMLYGDDRLEMQGSREAVGGYGECVLEFLNWEGKTPSKRIAVLLDSYYEESEEQPPVGLYSKYF